MREVVNTDNFINNWFVQNDYLDAFRIVAIILYDRSDQDFAEFINDRDNWQSLHNMSSTDFVFFIPAVKHMKKALSFKTSTTNQTAVKHLEKLQKIDEDVEDISVITYSLVRHFDLEYSNLPCILFFDNLDTQSYLLYEIPSNNRGGFSNYGKIADHMTFFRKLMDSGREFVQTGSDDNKEMLKHISQIWSTRSRITKWVTTESSIRKLLSKSMEKSVSGVL